MENKKLEDVINHPNFGNLAKLTVIGILTVGFAVSGVIIVANNGDVNAYVEAAKIFGAFAISALSGGVVTTFGKSETAKTILAQRSAQTAPNEYYGAEIHSIESTPSIHSDLA